MATLAVGRVIGDRRALFVRYEDVVQESLRCQAALAAFLGVSDARAAPAPRAAATSIVLPWEKWKENALAPVTANYVDAWREALPSDQSLDVAAICRSQMTRFGYSTPGNAIWSHRRLTRLQPEQQKRRERVRRSLTRNQRVIDAVDLG